MKPKATNNQNYTQVPDNSEIEVSPPSYKASESHPVVWDGTVRNQPDEDAREELGLPEINMSVFKSIFEKHGRTLLTELQACSQELLTKVCIQMRYRMAFLQLEVRIYGQGELNSEKAWKNFIESESPKISAGKFNAVVVLLGNDPSQIHFIVITKEKICELRFGQTENQQRLKSDINDKLLEIHAMINGKRFAEERKMFGPPPDPKTSEAAMAAHNATIQVEPPSRP
jgi:hypothetical protein